MKRIQYAVQLVNPVSGSKKPLTGRSVSYSKACTTGEELASQPENRGLRIYIMQKNPRVSNKFNRINYIKEQG